MATKRKYPLTRARLLDAMARRDECLDNPGFCLTCGAEAEGCEPDARDYKCDDCGSMRVFGAEEIFMMYG
jgi:hypothetical protein